VLGVGDRAAEEVDEEQQEDDRLQGDVEELLRVARRHPRGRLPRHRSTAGHETLG
jgi:hypothetical protein